MGFKFEYIFFAIFALVVGSLLFKFLKHGGFKAAMSGQALKMRPAKFLVTAQNS